MFPQLLTMCNRVGYQTLTPFNYLRANKVLLSSSCNLLAKKEDLMPRNPLDEFHSASKQAEKGVIYDRKPFRVHCEKGKIYFWCVCGKSKNQPFCDSTHKNPHMNIKMKPVRFTVTETKDYWLCNCKQTNNRPFCDGTHKGLEPPVTSRPTQH